MKKIFLLSISTILLVSCGKKAETKKSLADDDVVAVKLASVVQANSTDPIKASGLVGSLHEARLSFKTGGIIERIFVKEGQPVRKGTIISNAQFNRNQCSSATSQRKRTESRTGFETSK